MSIKAYDMSHLQRIVGVEGSRVRGSFHVLIPLNGRSRVWVKPFDVIIYGDEARTFGRVLYSGSLVGSVTDGTAEISRHMISPDVLGDVLDVWDEMHEVLVAVVAAAMGAKP